MWIKKILILFISLQMYALKLNASSINVQYRETLSHVLVQNYITSRESTNHKLSKEISRSDLIQTSIIVFTTLEASDGENRILLATDLFFKFRLVCRLSITLVFPRSI